MTDIFTDMLILIILLGLILRWYGINWDQGWHLHPDERMLIMVADRVQLFNQMNPDFFNYGSFPIYVLKGVSQLISFITSSNVASYDGMLSIGRSISVTLDLFTLILVYRTSKLIFDKKLTALFGAFLYAIAFFPIQNTHFFIVDNFLNCLMAILIYLLLRYVKQPSLKKIFFIAVATAAAVTTKATGVLLLAPIGLALLLPNKKQKISKYILHVVVSVLMFGLLFASFAYLFMPYAFSQNIILAELMKNPMRIFNPKLIDDITLQTKMNSDPFIFPYTLQYVITTPYLYYIKNIFLWGLGPFISVLSLLGFALYILTIKKFIKKLGGIKKTMHSLLIVLTKRRDVKYQVHNDNGLTPYYVVLMTGYVLFYLFYFLVLGRSAVKFMRYMLPLYAPLCVFGGFALDEFLTYYHKTKHKPTMMQIRLKPFINGLAVILFIGAVVWTLMFEQIYRNEHTRIAASDWMFYHIRPGSAVAVEHWDDRLPLPIHQNSYEFKELTLYDPDSPEKWQRLNSLLQQTDFIVIASNRLYTPLMKLTDCKKLPPGRCYQQTAEYYKKLFAGELGFKKVAEFTSYPKLQIGTWKLKIPDDSADESFTVYDHPKIMIFQRI